MRGIVCAAALANLFAASSALAADGDATTAVTVAKVAALATVPVLPDLHQLDFATTPPGAIDPFNRLAGVIRHRFASAMVDLYPGDSTGFHLSVGTRFFKKQYFRYDQEQATGGLLYAPRLPRGGFGQRGFRRATPAATLGYTQWVAPDLTVGLEGGALLGRVVEVLPHGRRLAGLPGGRDDERGARMNPVLNLSVGYAF